MNVFSFLAIPCLFCSPFFQKNMEFQFPLWFPGSFFLFFFVIWAGFEPATFAV